MLHLAARIITSKSGHFDPAQFEDRYETTLVELLKKKPVKKSSPPRLDRHRAWSI